MINIRVLRFEPGVDEKPHLESYEIPSKENMKVLDALQLINKIHGANIAFRSSCRAGQCGSCAVKMNGEVVLACRAEVVYAVLKAHLHCCSSKVTPANY